MQPVTVSEASLDMIVGFEVSSQQNYERNLQHPTFPGGLSGVTVGIGYDVGYQTPNIVRLDWNPYLDTQSITVLSHACGVKGRPAQSLAHLSEFQAISVSWDAAIGVFKSNDLDRAIRQTITALPGIVSLPSNSLGDCLGALVSLTFNRGASYNLAGDRYKEMRDIRAAVASRTWGAIPPAIIAMKRLWPLTTIDGKGLELRRDAEAALFKAGLEKGGSYGV